MAYYAARGWRVLVPLVSLCGYDFVAEREGRFVRVNVKRAHLKDRKHPNSWAITAARSERVTRADCDVYLAWLPHRERWVELPGDYLDGYSSGCRRLPKALTA